MKELVCLGEGKVESQVGTHVSKDAEIWVEAREEYMALDSPSVS